VLLAMQFLTRKVSDASLSFYFRFRVVGAIFKSPSTGATTCDANSLAAIEAVKARSRTIGRRTSFRQARPHSLSEITGLM